MFADRLAEVIETRACRPELVAEAAARRPRAPSFLSPGGTLVLIAADHTARGTLRAGRLMTAMADRTSLLERLCVALARPGVGRHGVDQQLHAVLGADRAGRRAGDRDHHRRVDPRPASDIVQQEFGGVTGKRSRRRHGGSLGQSTSAFK